MSIAFPRTDILTVGFSSITFKTNDVQELSRLAGGRTIGRDMGPSIWMASFVTEPLLNANAVAYEAKLRSLNGVLAPFEAIDLRRPNPRAHTDGFGNNGALASVSGSRAIALSGLAAGQTVSVGDYFSFDYAGSRALHQAMETVVANSSGVTAAFEVRPYLRPGWALGTAINVKAPRGLFNLMPNTVDPRGLGGTQTVISFQAAQVIQ